LGIFFGFVLWLLWEWFYIIIGPISMTEKIVYYFTLLLMGGGIIGLLLGLNVILEVMFLRDN
jgi:hypothetical protein